jgi:hypothetical protein
VAGFTVCATGEEVLVASLASPAYTAVIECPATERVEVASVATPPLSVPLPMAVVPSTKETLPEAVVGVTWAVKVTFVPKVDGFAEEVRVVVVVA